MTTTYEQTSLFRLPTQHTQSPNHLPQAISLRARLAERYGVPFRTYSAGELNALPGEFSGSDFVKGVTGVDCVSERAALLAAGAGAALVRKKTAGEGMTFALAELKEDVSFG